MIVSQRSFFQAHPFHLVLFTLTTTGVSTMHNFEHANFNLYISFITLILSIEGTYLGNHTLAVQKGLNMGVALFIVSEAFALSPTIELGKPINPFELPLLNTILLLSSGITVTYAHHSLIKGDRKGSLYGLAYTIILAIIFTAFQGIEYTVSSFTLSDGVFGSCFYFATGFHGLHVIIAYHITENHHLGLESGILY
ncbi:uncharacterized protein K452DRAFT_330031 [Aplosporella prunicola CBS 121167]|uniref:Cytochrome c oxidase subunit 3 n=1 Tax=Aplosporella prunicola CBS 121167 TaxID=1176127 RepID=A0A6A6AYB9_9PEZI|nr:uncharacterized protein K452DRAFT_330031 [Aplosporella prunicola CBS 121167]KAF2135777.1 hypothetical protein K452DRAFT_330031 [Aplosporella prunicola CBS 121167]